MTEAKWTSSTNPHELLIYLGKQASDRKLRLLACACARRILPLLTDKRTQEAIEVAGRYADGVADENELTRAHQAGKIAVKGTSGDTPGLVGIWIAHPKAAVTAREALAAVVRIKATIAKEASGSSLDETEGPSVWTSACVAELSAQANIVREVFGNPFHPVNLDSAWLLGKGGSVLRLAQEIYDKQTFGDLPKLASALKRAGCDNVEMLSHLRTAAEHVRGCCMLDLLLGKR